HAGLLEDRIGDRADVRVDTLQIADQVEVQRRRLDTLCGVAGQSLDVRAGIGTFEVAEHYLFGEPLLRAGEVAVQEYAHAESEVGDQPAVKVADLLHARRREAATFLDLFFLDVGDDPLDDVADLLHVDGERHDVGPAAPLLFLQRFAADLRQVELDRRVQL